MRGNMYIFAAGVLMMLMGCPGPAFDRSRPVVAPADDCCSAGNVIQRRKAIAKTAAKLVGARTIQYKGRKIRYDCAGVTRAIYLANGIDLFKDHGSRRGANGTKLIYNHVRRHGRLHKGPKAHPGDLVFFNNTWDSNDDGRVNDPITHVGVVERVEQDGTVVFISRVSRAIERYRMNLTKPHKHKSRNGRLLNDFMRRKRRSDPDNTRYLTGQLFAGFGTRVTH
jgi:hypothetical protein